MIPALFISIVLLYGGVQFLELCALIGRISGVQQQKVLIGYSIQQSVYMMTRLFIVVLLPMIGFAIDSGSSADSFAAMTHTSLFVATCFGLLSLVLSNPMLRYFGGVVNSFSNGGNFIRSFLQPSGTSHFSPLPRIGVIFRNRMAVKTFWQSNVVYLVYSTGLLVSFYFALIFPEYRVTISQMSGVFNALGAVLLTFLIEPRISRSIDESEDNPTELIFALYWGRLFATGVTGQIVLLLLFAIV